MTRRAPEAFVDALARPAIPNGRPFPVDRAGASQDLPPEARSRTTVLIQPAAYAWACDRCHRRGFGGFGGFALLAHSTATGHRMFTPLGRRPR